MLRRVLLPVLGRDLPLRAADIDASDHQDFGPRVHQHRGAALELDRCVAEAVPLEIRLE